MVCRLYLNFSNSTFPKQLHVYEQSGLPFSPVLHLWMFSRFFICLVLFCSPQIFPLSENTWQCTTKFTGMLCKTLFIDIMNYKIIESPCTSLYLCSSFLAILLKRWSSEKVFKNTTFSIIFTTRTTFCALNPQNQEVCLILPHII